ncbi:MAG: tRNA lysidine(34) synthetase TilS [Clostridia bacterium]|nr:tRNA lysidine(34) synthetase TilS [Clostridia bacterium]
MLSTVKDSIHDLCLLCGVKTLAVAVSGGADSVALLSIMLRLRGEYDIDVFAAHFNHKLRGKESESDMLFVKKLCEKLGVRLVCDEGDVAAFAKENKLSTELAARRMRYDFFGKLSADAVATAHTASDNLETVIFNLTRGSGINGLCGIPPKRGKFIRPLIFCTREQIEAYCRQNNLSYVTDSTNLSDDYSRNLIRHSVVPVLKRLNPSLENNVSNTSLQLAFDRDMLDNLAKNKYERMLTKTGLRVDNLTKYGPAISHRILRMFCLDKTGEVLDCFHTDSLFSVAVNGGRCSMQNGYYAVRQKGIIKIFSENEKVEYTVNFERLNYALIKNNQKINNLLLKNLIDCDKIVGELRIRNREPGDKIRLLGRGCTKTLKGLFNENSVPLIERESLPVISDDLGVVWVCKFGVAERAAASENSKFVYKIGYETVLGGNTTK